MVLYFLLPSSISQGQAGLGPETLFHSYEWPKRFPGPRCPLEPAIPAKVSVLLSKDLRSAYLVYLILDWSMRLPSNDGH